MKFDELFVNNSPVFLAPMAGITDAPFRKLVHSFGASATVSEMVSSEALVRSSAKTQMRLISLDDDNLLKIIQIVGANPENMAESAIMSENLGADVVDINMGCPVKKIVCNNSGSALMKDEDLAVKVAKSVVNAVKIPVTLKMRLGWDFDSINFLSLAKKFEDVGIRMLTIHCRTRSQMYSGKANWPAIEKLRDTVQIPYLCNGDIKSPESAAEALKQSRAHGVMVGRGALGKPWLLKQIMDGLHEKSPPSSPSVKSQFEMVMNHFRETLGFYGELHGIRFFRKHFCWYSAGLPGSSSFREAVNHIEDLSLVQKHVKEFYEKQML